ncbi:MAG: glucose-6-phosphate dehydrogenase [Dysgonamonadaceae bacterium]|jgi:glucose-6-phosphate 1-dehydrogenase|nr:glucose-6-phosphate dehydrogenase [Dysgonamonadaceae bacterium]MDD3356029.1 glucose-6-phosphate dehydrogenase [Dysgonamonadaceae bacterium]MDD3727266.1 glucose-6-phosphate dehydrogenase [Dysgonamonadaceae bacterium]MDD4246094.1 glucose-6-phosphate dehydrogenase [Dysgonamonadaceae bacterium]MDD4605224.1 glucose-6-phosphate dehydrogenase [Dysgonamonadaceae bacterium]
MNNPKKIDNQVMVIFGASGDLTYRKLLPAIFDLYENKLLPSHFAVLGVSRTNFTDHAFRDKMEKGIKQFSHYKNAPQARIDLFLSKVSYLSMDTGNGNEYGALKKRLSEINLKYKTDKNYIFYLSTPPQLYAKIPKFLYGQGLNLEHKGFRRIIIEKPFGHDLKSAQELNRQLLDFFNEDQIYRIDHYLGKETVQNLMVTRFANGIYEPLWNRNYIQHVEVSTVESIGVEGRGGYYDEAGALRDMVQNHLMQLIALIAMEPPTKINAEAIKYEKMKVFQALHPLSESDLKNNVIRGQYSASKIRGESVLGYREEKSVDKKSRTETFFAMKCFIDNWRWAGVPFYIRTGKRMPTRVSEIVIHFKPSPQQLFHQNEDNDNQLILRIQPDEGILLKTGMKMPGNGYEVKSVNMDFHYTDLDDHYIPEAYERLILDCMAGDSTLFMDGPSLEETWKFVQPILTYWENDKKAPLYGYPAGSWGPDKIDDLIEGENQKWRYPCKNLSDDGIYCEL